jgi:hypothetical protein
MIGGQRPMHPQPTTTPRTAGPRISAASLAAPPGVAVHEYIPDLYRHLAAWAIAIVHGGLTSVLEQRALADAGRPGQGEHCALPSLDALS